VSYDFFQLTILRVFGQVARVSQRCNRPRACVTAVSVCGILAICLTGWQTYEAARSDSLIASQLNQIEQQLKQMRDRAITQRVGGLGDDAQQVLERIQILRDNIGKLPK